MLDDRLVRVLFRENFEGGVNYDFENLKINATGNKTGSIVTNMAKISVTNIEKTVRDQLATKYRPADNHQRGINDRRGEIYLQVGRKSTGYNTIFSGSVTTISQSEPPDVTTTFHVVSNFNLSGDVGAWEFAAMPLGRLAEQIAKEMSLTPLVFLEERERKIRMPVTSYTGARSGLISILGDIPNIIATEDNGQLFVISTGAGLNNAPVEVNRDTFMVGVPTFLENGISVSTFAVPEISVGTVIKTTSITSPATNGIWTVISVAFNVTNRDNQFYYNLKCVPKVVN